MPSCVSICTHARSREGMRLGFLSDGAFFGEVPILDHTTGAEVRERTVTAMTDCRLIYIERVDMERLKRRYPELALRLKQCARVGRRVNKKSKRFKAAVSMGGLLSSPKDTMFGGPKKRLPGTKSTPATGCVPFVLVIPALLYQSGQARQRLFRVWLSQT